MEECRRGARGRRGAGEEGGGPEGPAPGGPADVRPIRRKGSRPRPCRSPVSRHPNVAASLSAPSTPSARQSRHRPPLSRIDTQYPKSQGRASGALQHSHTGPADAGRDYVALWHRRSGHRATKLAARKQHLSHYRNLKLCTHAPTRTPRTHNCSMKQQASRFVICPKIQWLLRGQ